MHRALLMLALLYAFQAAASSASDPLPYDRLQQKSVHNAYQRKESLADMLVNRNLRSLELDIYVDKSGRPHLDNDWYVYHTKSDSKSSVDTLRHGLEVLRQFNLSHPTHEVVTLWMDIKESFQVPNHEPADLDHIFREVLGSSLFTPEDLKDRCPGATDLQASVQNSGCSWPTAAELRGRFLIVLTEAPIMQYVREESLAFIAPLISKAETADTFRFAVFYNLSKGTAGGSDIAARLRWKHLISRTWDLNDKNTWNKIAARGVHHLATNKVNEAKDPWSTTIQSDGGPFACLLNRIYEFKAFVE